MFNWLRRLLIWEGPSGFVPPGLVRPAAWAANPGGAGWTASRVTGWTAGASGGYGWSAGEGG